MKVKTRFAPSPTGDLHVGSVRTALYSWLYARHSGGEFILRIEDTDLERSTLESCQAIIEGMAWLGLNYDNEKPIFQSERFDRYREVAQQLVQKGQAYRCYCSKERLETLREAQMNTKEKHRYDGLCRNLTETLDAPHVIRFKNPTDGAVTFVDRVRGEISVQNAELDDLIIARTDGSPTYNFTVVVDDWDMEITHVIRGDDHINNTPRQINILKALGATLPIYAHVPMILGSDHKRLSKRHGAVSVLAYRDKGYLPQALLNYLVRLGWSCGDQEIFSLEEMTSLFNLDHLNNSPAAFNFDKLDWLNQHYLKTMDEQVIAVLAQPFLETLPGVVMSSGPRLSEVVLIQRERSKTLKELAERSVYFYSDELVFDRDAITKHLPPSVAPLLEALIKAFLALSDWSPDSIMNIMKAIAESQDLKLGAVAAPIRVAVTGSAVSPPLGETLSLLGKKRTLERLTLALSME